MIHISITNKTKSTEIIAELEARFLEGERLSIEQIVAEFIKSTSTMSFLMGREQVRNWLSTLKKRFWTTHHLWFGRLNDLNQYGICDTEAEYRFSLTKYFNFIKGNLTRAVALKGEASEKGFVLADFKNQSFLLPAPTVTENKAVS